MHDDAELADLTDLLSFDKPRGRALPREDTRLLTIFRVGKLITDRFEELCLIRHVGVGGLMAAVHSPLRARQRVRIELRSDRRLWGNILWINDGTAGIGFDGQIDIDEVLARSAVRGDDRRSTGPRLRIDCMAKLRVGGRYRWVRVHDVGQTGIGVTSDEAIGDGEEVVIVLEGFRPVHGVALWSRDGRIGIALNQPIPFGELTHWLQEMFGSSSVMLRNEQPHSRQGPKKNPAEGRSAE